MANNVHNNENINCVGLLVVEVFVHIKQVVAPYHTIADRSILTDV
jgi:hypothetical protein